MKLKSLIKNDRADSYLIFYLIFAGLIFGGVYSIVSDIRDDIAPVYNDLAPLGNELNDADTIEGFDFLNMLLSFSIVLFLIGAVYYGYVMVQKPNKPW